MTEERSNHPTREKLTAFAHGKLDAAELHSVETHVGGCDTCCDVLREIPHDALAQRLRDTDLTNDPSAGDDDLRESSANPSPDLTVIPETLIDHSRYEVLRQLGAGGMGVVYLARHRLMGRTVALKVINGRLLKNSAAVERFRQEVKAAARLSHRNIVAAFDAEQAGDLHFLIMEYVPGTDLATVVKTRGRLPVMHACNYVMQAAQGLHHAHEQGMVHRDIKPQNLMVTPKGSVKILDFGLARLAAQTEDDVDPIGITREGATLGTPDYMSPEQARDSRRADIRSDIYSLGCTLYYLLSGVVPFPTGTAIEKVIAHCERSPKSLGELRDDIPVGIITIVERMMAKEPDSRFQTPKEVVEALKPFAISKPAAVPPMSIEATRADAATPLVLETRPAVERPASAQIPPEATEIEDTDEPKTAFSGTQHQGIPRRLPQRLSLPLALIVIFGLVMASCAIAFWFDRDNDLVQFGEQEEWVDLMQQINFDEYAVAGLWQLRGSELHVEPLPSARIMLPAPPGPEYDFEVEFTRNTGTNSVALVFVSGNGQATFEVDAWDGQMAGFQMIQGKDMRENGTQVSAAALENGRSYTMAVHVRRDRVEGYLDGTLLTTYRGDGADLSLLNLWQLPDAHRLGLGAYSSATTFHRVRVRKVTD